MPIRAVILDVGGVILHTLALFIQSLRPRYKVGLLSNAWSNARSIHNAKFKLNTWVDMAVSSAEVKLPSQI